MTSARSQSVASAPQQNGSARVASTRNVRVASSAGSEIAGRSSGRAHSVRSRSSGHQSGRLNSVRSGPPGGKNTSTRSMASSVHSQAPPAISTMSARSERKFIPSSAEIGLAEHQHEMGEEVQLAPAAGIPSAEVVYHSSGHVFPRFDRQKIRAYLDQTIVSGERQVEPGILQRIPTMHHPLSTPAPSSRQQQSARSQSSRAISKASTRSVNSCGSWLKQTEESVFRYKTNNSAYGTHSQTFDTGNKAGFQPGFGNGRELWQLGGYRGKNSSDFQNCLVDNNRFVPFLQ
eukprot:GEMP01051996.1.p1 GENE.GEMP01051996.1~~GEMP01051996.1.p1  ORF type:complete len:289 (+),score=44.95 GEMP01051996.1:129-995(+)